MKKVQFFLLLYFLFFCSNVFSIKIYIANLNIYKSDTNVELSDKEKSASELLFKMINKKDFDGLLDMGLVSQSVSFSDKITKSTVEASDLANFLHIDYLVYGFIEKSSNYYNAEIRVFENKNKIDKKTFYVKTDLCNIEEVINELSEKFTNYMHDILGLSIYHEERKIGFGGICIYNSAGYWFPLSDWRNIITGLASFETGVNVIPAMPLGKIRNFAYYLRVGLYASYSLAMNKPDYLESYYHSIFIKIPAENCFEIFFNHVFIIGAGPQLELDIIYQKMLFDVPYTDIRAAFSIFTNIAYEYWFGEKKITGVGINNIFDFTFYKEIFIDYKIQLYSIVRIPAGNKKKNEGKNL